MALLSDYLSGGGGGSRKVEIFTESGTWTRPTGVYSVEVVLIGGGGAGGRSNCTSSGSNAAGGGGGGGCYRTLKLPVSNDVDIEIGIGGIPALFFNDDGSGGTSKFGGYWAIGGSAGCESPYYAAIGANGGGGGYLSNNDIAACGGGGGGAGGMIERPSTIYPATGLVQYLYGTPGSRGWSGNQSHKQDDPRSPMTKHGNPGINGYCGGGGGGQVGDTDAHQSISPIGNDGGGNGAMAETAGEVRDGYDAADNKGGGGGGSGLRRAGYSGAFVAYGGAGGSGLCVVTWVE